VKWWTLFVARRFLGTGRSRGAGASGLSIAGIAAGTATLIVVLAVMNGFQLGTIESILEVNSFHLRLLTGRPAGDDSDLDAIVAEIARSSAVAAAVPSVEIQTLARGFWPEPQGILIRGVPADWLERDTGAADRIVLVSGRFDVESPGSIVVGSELARALGLRVGDPMAVTHIPAGSTRPAEVSLTVTGIFRTGFLDFDRNWAFTGLSTAATSLQATDPVVVGIKLTNRFRDQAAASELRALIPEAWEVENWREYNRGIFGALRVEKSMMIFLVALIFVVVAGNIYQLLRRSILERSEEIAILRALGALPEDLRTVFALEGWLIGVSGTIIGTLIGLFVAYNVNAIFALLGTAAELLGGRGFLVFSAAHFYIEGIPARILPRELLLIAAGAIGSAVLSSRLAGRTVVQRMPNEILRSE
jgi:lipoprotein-releasing system permease protein